MITYDNHDIEYFQVCIVDMIRVDNNNEHQLDELLSGQERKWIWDLGSTTPYCLSKMMLFTDQAIGAEIVSPFQDFTTVDSHIFIYIVTVFYYQTIFFFYWIDCIWLLICDINCEFIFHANFSFSYYS